MPPVTQNIRERIDAVSETAAKAKTPLPLVFLWILGGAIGWFASFELLTEYIKVLDNPDYTPNCSFSVLVTCAPNMSSWQGSIFGFSNTIIGVSAFIAPILVGFSVLAGGRFKAWYWLVYNLGLLGGYILITWLYFQSIFSLHTLCPWCMVVWSVMIPMFWYSTFWNAKEGRFGARFTRAGEALLSWAWVIVFINYVVIAVLAQYRLDFLGLY